MGNFGNKWNKFVQIFIEKNGYVKVVQGLQNTLLIAVVGMLIGVLIGTIIATVRVLPKYKTLPRALNAVCSFYVGLFRGTPMVVQLLIFYYVMLPLMGINEFVRMWVADMEFGVAPEILDELRKRIDRRIFGYTGVYTHDYYNSFSKWCKEHYDWSFPEEELCFTPGIIPALYQLTETLCNKDEKVLMNTPAYGYFLHSAEYAGVDVLQSPLKKKPDGTFELDYENFEQQCANPQCKMVFWCNPQNPTGRMWTEEELRRIAGIVEKYNLWIVSDEIHCDLIRCGRKHIPMAKVMTSYPKLITCMAPSKTFNLAGLAFSNIIIRDPVLRERFKERDKLFGMVNPMSLTAAKAAYDKGGAWHEELKQYLDANFAFVKDFFDKNLPDAVMYIPEATYLAWVDLSKCLPDVEDLPDFFANKAGVLLEGGNSLFVGNAAGYIRLNLAMPRSILKTGLERMRDTINAHNKH